MSTGRTAPSGFDERLSRIEAVTDTALAQLNFEELLAELLERTRDLLDVDTAAVLLLDPSAQYLVATAARGIEEEVRQGSRVPVGQGFAGGIAADGKPMIITDVNDTNVLNPVLRKRGIKSLLGVPLVASGTPLGVLHVGTLSTRHFTEADTELLRLVADRVALATQVRLSGADRAAATALHRNLLPAALPALQGVELAARYVPGGDGDVGGDWYDVFALPSGWLCLAVGDVVGRGLPAATVMGRLRSALQAFALDSESPADLLSKLDRVVQHFEPKMMATVLYAMLEPSHERLHLSSAGHVPPVLRERDMPATIIDLPVDAPLGIGANSPRHTSTIAVSSGGAVCFYTDGLVERRGRPLDVGLERLRSTMSVGPPETVCAAVMSELLGADTPVDDVALLVLRRQHTPTTEPLNLVVPALPISLADTRAEIRRWLRDVGVGPVDAGEFLVSVGEACANVVEHAYGPRGGPLAVHLVFRAPDLLATVRDTGQWRSPRGENRGRGIALIRALCDDVQIERGAAGTEVTIRRRLTEELHR